MDKLTPEAVAKHAAEHPLHIKLAPNHIEGFVVEGLPLGQWRYMGDDPQAFPMFFAVALDGTAIRAMCMEGRYEMDLDGCPPGTWTPVRQDGSDLPDDRAMTMLQASLGKRPDNVAQGVLAMIERLSACAERHGQEYERGRADERRRCAEIDAETGNAERRAALLREAYERGRVDGQAEERAAIVAGVEGEVERLEGAPDEKHVTGQRDGRLRRSGKVAALRVLLGRLRAGEWSAKP